MTSINIIPVCNEKELEEQCANRERNKQQVRESVNKIINHAAYPHIGSTRRFNNPLNITLLQFPRDPSIAFAFRQFLLSRIVFSDSFITCRSKYNRVNRVHISW